MLKKLYIIFNIPRLLSAYFFFCVSKNRHILKEDISTWQEWKGVSYLPFFYLMTMYKEFRNVVYMRIGRISLLVKWLAPPPRFSVYN